MTTRIALISVLMAGVLLACDEMESISQITKFRVMGVQAEPPEIQPGQGTVLRVLYADPKGEGRDVQIFWATCVGSFSPTDDLESGCEPIWIPQLPLSASRGGDVYRILSTPTDILSAAADSGSQPDGGQKTQGEEVTSVPVTVIVVLCAGGEFPDLESFSAAGEIQLFKELCRGGDGLVAVKTFRISDSKVPNENPVIEKVTFEGELLSDDPDAGPAQYQCEKSSGCREQVDIEAYFTSESYQSYYDQLRRDDQKEDPYISWFITGGKFNTDRSRAADPPGPVPVEWKPPRYGGVYTMWAVAHDRRGGVSWKTYTVEATLP